MDWRITSSVKKSNMAHDYWLYCVISITTIVKRSFLHCYCYYSIMTCVCLCNNSRLFSVHAEPTPVQVLPTALNLRSDLRGVRSTDINGVVHVVLVVSDSNISQSHVSAVGPQTGEAEEDGATAGLVKWIWAVAGRFAENQHGSQGPNLRLCTPNSNMNARPATWRLGDLAVPRKVSRPTRLQRKTACAQKHPITTRNLSSISFAPKKP